MTDNAFAPPRSNVEVHEGPETLWEITFKDVRKLYLASRNVYGLGVLFGLGALGLLVTAGITGLAPGAGSPPPPGLLAFLLFLGLFFAAASVTTITRPRWGRVLGMILCVLSLFNFPIGTIIGLVGLIAYGQGGKLFGADRLHHKDIAAVYKQRKKDKK